MKNQLKNAMERLFSPASSHLIKDRADQLKNAIARLTSAHTLPYLIKDRKDQLKNVMARLFSVFSP